MRTLTAHEQRTIRIAAAALGIYLVLFFGLRSCRQAESGLSERQKLIREVQLLKAELRPYENKTLLLEKLKKTLKVDLPKLSKATVVAAASAAIQQAAAGGGVQLGPIRESPARPSARELTSMQVEGMGPVPAVMALLHRLETLSCPLILDSIQLNADPARPGPIKFTLTIVIVDFEEWKSEGGRDA